MSYIRLTVQVVTSGSATRVVLSDELSDERKPSSIRRLIVTLSRPGAPLCLPVGSDCQIRSQKFPSDVCWGKWSRPWECELSPASPTAGSVCYGDEGEGREKATQTLRPLCL